MTGEEAKKVLRFEGAPDEAAITDAFDEQLFELKDFLIKQPPVRKVFLKKVKGIERLFQARAVLLEHDFEPLPVAATEQSDQFKNIGFKQALSTYSQQNTLLKHHLNQAERLSDIQRLVIELIVLEEAFEDCLVAEIEGKLDTENVEQEEIPPVNQRIDIMELFEFEHSGAAVEEKLMKKLKGEYHRIRKAQKLRG